MAKLYFRYGVMGSSKTAEALMTRHNYQEKGGYVWLIKPAGCPGGTPVIKSRIGLSAEADLIDAETDIYECVKNDNILSQVSLSAIIADEAQFFTKEQIRQFRLIVDRLGIPVFCYGLRTDFKGRLFEGSAELFALADTLTELKNVCKCGKKAIINARVDENGNVLTEGLLKTPPKGAGYESMCYTCWKEKQKKS